ncbi:glycosyltransferase family A protein [soil metagenome]
MIDAIGIVVPVHDEAERLERCLAALDEAIASVDLSIACVAMIVLDACTDRSEAIVTSWSDGSVRSSLVVDVRNVGRARAAGFSSLLEMLSGFTRDRTWLATTDGDTEVSRSWLVDQLALAEHGVEAIAGSVRVSDWEGHRDPAVIATRFAEVYAPAGSDDTHTHVHGANLGFRADAYLAAGGFSPLCTAEDHELWNALDRAGRRRVSSRKIAVTTSARLGARAPEGFSEFLRQLGARE